MTAEPSPNSVTPREIASCRSRTYVKKCAVRLRLHSLNGCPYVPRLYRGPTRFVILAIDLRPCLHSLTDHTLLATCIVVEKASCRSLIKPLLRAHNFVYLRKAQRLHASGNSGSCFVTHYTNSVGPCCCIITRLADMASTPASAAGIQPKAASSLQRSDTSSANEPSASAASHNAAVDNSSGGEPQPSRVVTQSNQLRHLAAKNLKELAEGIQASPEVLVHNAEQVSLNKTRDDPTSSGLLVPISDDMGTQVSSSSGSVKPPSLDGKSIASGTTFALDEKESLRPDDSASLKAVDDEDNFSAPSAERIGTHLDCGNGSRAFNEQLHEIDSLEPARACTTPQRLAPGLSASRGVLYVPPHGPGIGHIPTSRDELGHPVDFAPDPKLLEALESPRDRIWVLKLEQDIFDFVKDAKENSLDLPQCNAYHRMLAHKIADYYSLGHFVDDSASAVRLFKTPNLRIPPPLTGITTPSTAASTPPPAAPQMKILRRNDGGLMGADGFRSSSKTNSENGESGAEDDKSKPATREEREARYAAARLRIMGSSKPSDVTDSPTEGEESRSSSGAGKKGRKKPRSDSEDGFEARSAFVHYAQPYGANAFTQMQYAYPGYHEPPNAKMNSAVTYSNHDDASAFRRYTHQTPGVGAWNGQSFGHGGQSNKWSPATPSAFDLASDFQSAMSLQIQSTPTHSPAQPTTFGTNYGNQYYQDMQASWPQQNLSMPQQAQQMYGHPPHGQVRPSSSSSYGQEPQSYQFGQLPSQTFPGRPSSNLEHPLPGSYKSKHFDPQIQSFVPSGVLPFRAFTPQVTPNSAYNSGYGFPSPVQRQGSSQSQASSFGSSHAGGGVALTHQPSPHSMTPHSKVHPLPQPVFPRQPSPSLPLPPKPYSSSQRASPPHRQAVAETQGVPYVPSSIAKWGAPASLPAKPPPPTEPFDSTRYPQMQRQPSYGNAAAARKPGGSVPSGFVSSIAANGSGVPIVVNGSNQNIQRNA
nr:r3h domain-containing protein 2 [Quercus suber]